LPAAVAAEEVANGMGPLFGMVLDNSNPVPPDSDDTPDTDDNWFPDPVDSGIPTGFQPLEGPASEKSLNGGSEEDPITDHPDEEIPSDDGPDIDPAPPHLFRSEVIGREGGTPQVPIGDIVIIDLEMVNEHLAPVRVDITLRDHVTGEILHRITSEDGFLVEAGSTEQVKMPFLITHEGLNLADIEVAQRGGESLFLSVEFEGVRPLGQSQQVGLNNTQSDSLPLGLVALALTAVIALLVTTRAAHHRTPAAPREKDPYYARFDLLDLD